MNRQTWQRRVSRYKKRGISGLDIPLVRREWQAAAELWQRYGVNVGRWTIDLGAGNGRFWDLVETPNRIALIDIATGFDDHSGQSNRLIADANVLCVKRKSVGCVVALGLLEYLPDVEAALAGWREAAAEDCILILSNSPPMLQNKLRRFFDPIVHLYSDAEICGFLENTGWRIIDRPVRAGWQSLFAAKIQR